QRREDFGIGRAAGRHVVAQRQLVTQVILEHRGEARAPRSQIEIAQIDPVDAEDRKSTRLNSSHDQISYAVFCLKKKKIPNEKRLYQYVGAQAARIDTFLDNHCPTWYFFSYECIRRHAASQVPAYRFS